MVVIFKKTGIIAVGVVLFCAILVGLMVRSSPNVSSRVMLSRSSVIVIDPGHGGIDGGAQSPDGRCEKDYNLAVAKALKKICDKAQIKTILTRDGDDLPLTYSPEQTPLSKKRQDLNYRRTLPKTKKADLLITIHMNKFQSTKAHGAQVFYDTHFEGSEQLAAAIQKELLTLDPTNTRTSKPAESSIYLFKNPNVPTILVECGFLSNPEEEKKLRSSSYQKKLAQCIYQGILRYTAQKPPKKSAPKTTVIFPPFDTGCAR